MEGGGTGAWASLEFKAKWVALGEAKFLRVPLLPWWERGVRLLAGSAFLSLCGAVWSSSLHTGPGCLSQAQAWLCYSAVTSMSEIPSLWVRAGYGEWVCTGHPLLAHSTPRISAPCRSEALVEDLTSAPHRPCWVNSSSRCTKAPLRVSR